MFENQMFENQMFENKVIRKMDRIFEYVEWEEWSKRLHIRYYQFVELMLTLIFEQTIFEHVGRFIVCLNPTW
jgi:hypothetical protein